MKVILQFLKPCLSFRFLVYNHLNIKQGQVVVKFLERIG